MMKKIFFFVLFIVGTITASAQTINWNVNAGIGVSNLYGKNTDGADAKFAYRVGVGMELPFNSMWSLQTGLNFTSKGCKARGYLEDDYESKNVTINALYLELPIQAGLRLPTANNFDVLLKAGPYLGYGIGGKAKAGGYKEDTFGDNGFKKFDAGLGFGVGFEFSKFIVGINTQLGLINVADGGDIIKPKNISAFLTFGYKF